MLITGIRHAIGSELDTRRSAVFMKYLIYYLEMFALLGLILPIVIVVDFFSEPIINDEIVTNKYYQVMDDMNQEYFFYTSSYRFISDIIFYQNTNISDQIIFRRTPIFKTVTSISHQSKQLVYTCKPNSIYGWPLIIASLTFVLSMIFIIKMWKGHKKREFVKYDSMVNLGIINAILCSFIIIVTLCHIPN